MNLRRGILALALVVLAGVLAWIAFSPAVSSEGRLAFLGFALLALVAAAVLFVWRRVGSVLAVVAGGVGFFWGAVLAGLAGLSNSSPAPAVLATFWLGAAIGVFAIIDLAALLLARRATGAP